jgi:hypothetical protein
MALHRSVQTEPRVGSLKNPAIYRRRRACLQCRNCASLLVRSRNCASLDFKIRLQCAESCVGRLGRLIYQPKYNSSGKGGAAFLRISAIGMQITNSMSTTMDGAENSGVPARVPVPATHTMSMPCVPRFRSCREILSSSYRTS